MLADNFARHPLQVWNFGHVIDNVSPRCRAAWTVGIQSGDESRVKKGLARCGDSLAAAKAENPTVGQAGTGLVLLLFGTILLLFGAYLAIKVMGSALDAIYHAFMGIFGFAAGGFIYGPTQTFLVRNLVDTLMAAGKMLAYTVFLGVYALTLNSLFAQAGSNGIMVIFVCGIVEIVAIVQLRRLDAGLDRGNDWIAQRFAATVAGPPAASSGGAVLGMGPGSQNHVLSSGFNKILAAANDSIVLQQVLRTTHPFMPFAHSRQRAERVGFAESMVGNIGERTEAVRVGQEQAILQGRQLRVIRDRVRSAAGDAGGIGTRFGVAGAIQAAMDQKAGNPGAMALELGADDHAVGHALRVDSLIENKRASWLPSVYGKLIAATQVAEDNIRDTGSLGAAEYAALHLHAERLTAGTPAVDLNQLGPAGSARRVRVEQQAAELRRKTQDPSYYFSGEDLKYMTDNHGNVIRDSAGNRTAIDPIAVKLAGHVVAEDSLSAVRAYGTVYQRNPLAPELGTVLDRVREVRDLSSSEVGLSQGPTTAV